MWPEGRTEKAGCCMADLEHARSMLRMTHKDFNCVKSQNTFLSVIPAYVGIHSAFAITNAGWIPAYAGKTINRGVLINSCGRKERKNDSIGMTWTKMG